MIADTPKKSDGFSSIYILSITIAAVMVILFFFNNLDKLLYEPLIKADQWCESQPCIKITFLSSEIILSKPTSSIMVYALGLLTVGIGVYFLRNNKEHVSIQWWGISMIYWGLGAIFAGTSYQLFGYELKCAGREYCLWTSWWEISYLLLTVGAVNAMLMAQSYSCAIGRGRKIIKGYAALNSCIYIVILIIGSIDPIRFLISFELLVLFLLPTTLFFFLLNTKRFLQDHNLMDRNLLILWLLLGIIIIAYYGYYLLGITEILWEQGIWFSENDVLHIGLILWMLYIARIIPKYVKDKE